MNSENLSDLLGMPIAPTKRTNDRPEAAALCEVLTPYHVTRKRKAVANEGHQGNDDFPDGDDPRDYQ